MKKIVMGILAHVDSGKTTLSEAMLYSSGVIRRLGRVDHKDAFLDTHPIEKERGITIFSKEAVFSLENTVISLLDTPGHVDFSAEAERTLKVLDYAVLVISGSEGVQSHAETLWSLLSKYNIPTFIFVNKMDINGAERDKVLKELKGRFTEYCIDFEGDFYEEAATATNTVMEEFLETDSISNESITDLIAKRKLFPCFFGSALKNDGVEKLLSAIDKFTKPLPDSHEFGAKVFKISEDDKKERLTYMKITGGVLKVRTLLEYGGKSEKVNSIRIYSGSRFESVDEAGIGTVCAVTGLSEAYPGMGIGKEKDTKELITEPVLSCCVNLEEGYDIHSALVNLRKIEAEEPLFRVVWNERLKEIHIQVMGEVQLEILKQLLFDRFGMNVTFSEGSILYKETIVSGAEGVGHYEPLRHYAEVHLLLEPTERGSGLTFSSSLSEDKLDKNWQRLILTHLAEKTHIGVLTGSPITDMKITLTAGKAHLKHTEGGDFRQATYRAVRNGLRFSESILLEPWYNFRLSVPTENVGRALTDISAMSGSFSEPMNDGEFSVISGSVPVVNMRGYQKEVTSYTKGRGKLFCTFKGYEQCHNQDEVIEKLGYDCDADLENTADSVFCAHGAGFNVKWNKVSEYMHLEGISEKEEEEEESIKRYIKTIATDKELMRIFENTYGPVRHEIKDAVVRRADNTPSEKKFKMKPLPEGPLYLLVDGYNIIFAWDDLKAIASESLEAAREQLIDILCEYAGVKDCELILVFDAYKVKGNKGSIEKIRNINVVYTKEAETADMYIEKVTHILGKKHRVRVATSDNLEQLIILGAGALRVSAESFLKEVTEVKREISEYVKNGLK